jgi:hypothetical protein
MQERAKRIGHQQGQEGRESDLCAAKAHLQQLEEKLQHVHVTMSHSQSDELAESICIANIRESELVDAGIAAKHWRAAQEPLQLWQIALGARTTQRCLLSAPTQANL